MHYIKMRELEVYVLCNQIRLYHELWERLSEFGEKGQCGCLKDKYGVSWEIVPSIFDEMLHDQDAEKAYRVMRTCFKWLK